MTLTYATEHLPFNYGLDRPAFTAFIKALKRKVGKLPHLACGEYGGEDGLDRPHYHLVLFGYAFERDRYYFTKRDGHPVYRSPTLEKLWPYGHSEIGDLRPGGAGYVARYVFKKFKGTEERVRDHYAKADPLTGEVLERTPPFRSTSRDPAPGRSFVDNYSNDLARGPARVEGLPRAIPRYYLRRLRQTDPELALQLKSHRAEQREERQARLSPDERFERFDPIRSRTRDQATRSILNTKSKRK